jgi:hypothetical protein
VVESPFDLNILDNDNMQTSDTNIKNNLKYCYIAVILCMYVLYIFYDDVYSHLQTFFSFFTWFSLKVACLSRNMKESFMLGWPCALNYMNNNQHDALFIFSWIIYHHTSTCFVHISSPSSVGRMYICGKMVFVILLSWLSVAWMEASYEHAPGLFKF